MAANGLGRPNMVYVLWGVVFCRGRIRKDVSAARAEFNGAFCFCPEKEDKRKPRTILGRRGTARGKKLGRGGGTSRTRLMAFCGIRGFFFLFFSQLSLRNQGESDRDLATAREVQCRVRKKKSNVHDWSSGIDWAEVCHLPAAVLSKTSGSDRWRDGDC